MLKKSFESISEGFDAVYVGILTVGNWDVGAALHEIEANVYRLSNEKIFKETPIGVLTVGNWGTIRKLMASSQQLRF